MKLSLPIAFAAILSICSSVVAQDVVSDVDKAPKATRHATAKVAKESAHGTKTVTETTAHAAGHAGKETGQGVAKGVKGVGHGIKKATSIKPDAPK